jgi:hypothetical protein
MTMSARSLPVLFSAALTLGIPACSVEDAGGDLPFEGEVDQAGKADHLSIPFTELFAEIEFSRRAQGGKLIITSGSSWEANMGTPAPAEVDFSKEWVAFYGGGLRNTGGYAADIVGLELTGDGGLLVSTRSISPGPDCIVTQAPTTPQMLVKFAIPSPRPFYAVGHHEHETRRCRSTNEERLAELATSREAWEQAKLDNMNTYTYEREFNSFIGLTGRTTIVVEDGVVTERHYKQAHINGGSHEQWSELGADVGSHVQGFAPVLIDALYDECRDEVLVQDEEENLMSFSLDSRGLLQACTYFPRNCADDCERGPRISSLTF